MKASTDANIGDTLHSKDINPENLVALPSVQRSNPMVFAGEGRFSDVITTAIETRLSKKRVPLPMMDTMNNKNGIIPGVYPEDQSKNTELRSAIERLVLNDNSVKVSLESSPALGQGWRLGFLGAWKNPP